MSNKPLNVGLVGGGRGAFIVHPHQKAIHFDGTRRVVAGRALSRSKDRPGRSGQLALPDQGLRLLR